MMEIENTSLDDILNGEPAPQPAEVAEPAAEARPRDEHGRFAPKGDAEPAPAAEAPGASPAPAEEPPLEHPALIGERRRRQEAERRAQELEQQLSSARQPPQPAPSIWEDEQGALQHFGQQVVSAAVQEATFNARLDMSEMTARQQNPDFDEVKERFLEMMRDTPGLQQKALAEAHPWDFAYRYVKNADRMTELGATNVSDLEARLREQIRAELQAEAVKAVGAVPPTLSTERNAGQRSGPAWSGPASISDLLR